MYTYFLLELALVMFATGVAFTVEQIKVVLDELELRRHDPIPCGAYAPDPKPRVSLHERGYGNLTARGCAWIKRVASPGIVLSTAYELCERDVVRAHTRLFGDTRHSK